MLRMSENSDDETKAVAEAVTDEARTVEQMASVVDKAYLQSLLDVLLSARAMAVDERSKVREVFAETEIKRVEPLIEDNITSLEDAWLIDDELPTSSSIMVAESTAPTAMKSTIAVAERIENIKKDFNILSENKVKAGAFNLTPNLPLHPVTGLQISLPTDFQYQKASLQLKDSIDQNLKFFLKVFPKLKKWKSQQAEQVEQSGQPKAPSPDVTLADQFSLLGKEISKYEALHTQFSTARAVSGPQKDALELSCIESFYEAFVGMVEILIELSEALATLREYIAERARMEFAVPSEIAHPVKSASSLEAGKRQSEGPPTTPAQNSAGIEVKIGTTLDVTLQALKDGHKTLTLICANSMGQLGGVSSPKIKAQEESCMRDLTSFLHPERVMELFHALFMHLKDPFGSHKVFYCTVSSIVRGFMRGHTHSYTNSYMAFRFPRSLKDIPSVSATATPLSHLALDPLKVLQDLEMSPAALICIELFIPSNSEGWTLENLVVVRLMYAEAVSRSMYYEQRTKLTSVDFLTGMLFSKNPQAMEDAEHDLQYGTAAWAKLLKEACTDKCEKFIAAGWGVGEYSNSPIMMAQALMQAVKRLENLIAVDMAVVSSDSKNLFQPIFNESQEEFSGDAIWYTLSADTETAIKTYDVTQNLPLTMQRRLCNGLNLDASLNLSHMMHPPALFNNFFLWVLRRIYSLKLAAKVYRTSEREVLLNAYMADQDMKEAIFETLRGLKDYANHPDFDKIVKFVCPLGFRLSDGSQNFKRLFTHADAETKNPDILKMKEIACYVIEFSVAALPSMFIEIMSLSKRVVVSFPGGKLKIVLDSSIDQKIQPEEYLDYDSKHALARIESEDARLHSAIAAFLAQHPQDGRVRKIETLCFLLNQNMLSFKEVREELTALQELDTGEIKESRPAREIQNMALSALTLAPTSVPTQKADDWEFCCSVLQPLCDELNMYFEILTALDERRDVLSEVRDLLSTLGEKASSNFMTEAEYFSFYLSTEITEIFNRPQADQGALESKGCLPGDEAKQSSSIDMLNATTATPVKQQTEATSRNNGSQHCLSEFTNTL